MDYKFIPAGFNRKIFSIEETVSIETASFLVYSPVKLPCFEKDYFNRFPFFSLFLFEFFLLAFEWDDSQIMFSLIWIRILLLFAVFLLIKFDKQTKNSLISFIRHIYPIILSGYFYAETVYFNPFKMDAIDPFLLQWDQMIFGFQPSIYFSETFPNLFWSEIMYFSYFSFYLLIAGFVLYVFFLKKTILNEVIFKLSFSMYFFYFIFLLIPSEGPQFYFNEPQNQLPDAYFFNHIMHFIQKMAEQPTGAFPSSHVGISIIILIISYNRMMPFFKLSWPFVVLLILSTVYIKAHYFVDILGGLFIAPIILYLSHKIFSLLRKSPQII